MPALVEACNDPEIPRWIPVIPSPYTEEDARAFIGGHSLSEPGYSVPDQWQVQIQAQILSKAAVQIKTSGLTPDELRSAHLTPIEDVSRAVTEALRRAGPGATLCVLPQGPQTIPYLK